MSVDLGPAELEAIRNNIEDHDDLQRFLEAGFESAGWDVITEVNPDNSDLRVDLLLINGRCRIGVELKYLYPGDGTTKIGRAVQKIKNQYSTKKYFGDFIGLWAVGVYGRWFSHWESNDYSDWANAFGKGKREATQNILNSQNIGYIRSRSQQVNIEFSSSDSEQKVPGFAASSGSIAWGQESMELDAIRQKSGVSP